MGGSVSHIACFVVPGLNLTIYNEQLCEAKDICVVIENKKTKKQKNLFHITSGFVIWANNPV